MGPMNTNSSWEWVGKDIGNFIEENYKSINIKFFIRLEDIPMRANVCWIKSPLKDAQIKYATDKKLKIIFFPVDSMESIQAFDNHRSMIDYAVAIASHTETLNSYFPYKKTFLVDHYNKYGIDSTRRTLINHNNSLLWVGGYQFVPYIQYFFKNKDTSNVVLLTNKTCRRAIRAAEKVGNTLKITPSVENFKIIEWSPASQEKCLSNCRGAFDYKHVECFSQNYKPPTKAQKYICSGIPLALNEESYSYKYLQKKGFDVCNLNNIFDWERWFSEKYLKETLNFSKQLKEELTIKAVAESYINIFKEIF